MHELSITQSILDIAKQVAQEHGATKVKTVHIKLGEYSGVVPQCVQDYFDVISQGTIAQGAVLDIHRKPLDVPHRPGGGAGHPAASGGHPLS